MSTPERILNVSDDVVLEENEELVNEDQLESPPPITDEEDIFEVPEKYKGKSAKDLVEMHQNLERKLGQQGQELGDLRRMADEYIKSQLTARETPPAKEDFDIDFDQLADNPKETISRIVKKELESVTSTLHKQTAEREFDKFVSKHPDYTDVGNSPEFADFVSASPYRQRLYQQANNFDYEAADELLTIFKDTHSAKHTEQEEKAAEQKQKRDKELRKAQLESGSSGGKTRKVFRRADLIRMMQTDPERYMSMQAEIMQAYSEGRVK